jgi:hypothetical protein
MLAGRQVSAGITTQLYRCVDIKSSGNSQRQFAAWPPPCPTYSDNNARHANVGGFASRTSGAELHCFVCRVTDMNLPFTSGWAVPGTDPKQKSEATESGP